MSEIAKLLERVKALSGPDRDTDHAIRRALSKAPSVIPLAYLRMGNDADDTPKFTASIDAALALAKRVLPGWTWTLDNLGKLPSHAPSFRCIMKRPDEWLPMTDAKAPTAPLAILAATLAAMQARGEP